jgi:hypothetical protein
MADSKRCFQRIGIVKTLLILLTAISLWTAQVFIAGDVGGQSPQPTLPMPPPTPEPQLPVLDLNTPEPPGSDPSKPLPPLRYVNHSEILLGYKLSKVGKSGIGSVELYWTRNDGKSWELYASDVKGGGTIQNGPQQATVELPGEGRYGFLMVAKNRAGLGKPSPRLGDIPEMRVEVDTTPPVAQLFAPAPDPERPGHLLLKWFAKDNNLADNPISLEWSEKREGPWQDIVKDYRNAGEFAWLILDQLPVEVYIRLRVRDLAGNESIAVTQEPHLVDLSEPEVTLLDVSVVHRKK